MILTNIGIVDKFSKTYQSRFCENPSIDHVVVPRVQTDGQLDRTISVADLQLLPGVHMCLKIGICVCNNIY